MIEQNKGKDQGHMENIYLSSDFKGPIWKKVVESHSQLVRQWHFGLAVQTGHQGRYLM